MAAPALILQGQRVRRLLIVQLVGGLGMLLVTMALLLLVAQRPPDAGSYTIFGAGALLVLGLSFSSYLRLGRINQTLTLGNGKFVLTQGDRRVTVDLRDIATVRLRAIDTGRLERHLFEFLNTSGGQLALINAYLFEPAQLRALLTRLRTDAPAATFDDGVQRYLGG